MQFNQQKDVLNFKSHTYPGTMKQGSENAFCPLAIFQPGYLVDQYHISKFTVVKY